VGFFAAFLALIRMRDNEFDRLRDDVDYGAVAECRDGRRDVDSPTEHPTPVGPFGRAALLDASVASDLAASPAEWRCRESNPGPSSCCQGFSGRSPRCLYSAPVIMQASSP
jgi:hypothetical protein